MANLGVLRAQVRAIADVDATDVSDAEINTYINDSYQEVIADEQWPFLLTRVSFNTTAAQSDYAASFIAADLETHRIVSVQSAGVHLEQIQPQSYFDMLPFGGSVVGSTSIAVWTVLDGTKLVLYPTPSSVFAVQVVYLKLASDLTQDSHEPLFPSRYHYVLKWGGLKYVYQKIGDLESGEGAQKQFDEAQTSMVADLVKANRQHELIWGEGNPVRPTRLRWPWE